MINASGIDQKVTLFDFLESKKIDYGSGKFV